MEYQNDNLYELFLSIRKSSIKNISTAFSFYTSVTDTISLNEKSDICRFLRSSGNYQVSNNIHKYYEYYSNEKTTLQFHNNYIVVRTNKSDSKVIDYISELAEYFMCDFASCKGEFLSKRNLVLE